MKIVFLDIDGVLNDHTFNEDVQSTTFNPQCVSEFNRIIAETQAKIVLSSAWRYMVIAGAMTLTGFSYLLRSHGVQGELIDHTQSDEEVPTRRMQIGNWLRRANDVDAFVVLDDLPSVWPDRSFVKTESTYGLRPEDSKRAIGILNDVSILEE